MTRCMALVGLLALAGCRDDSFVASSDTLPLDVTWKLVSVGPQGSAQAVDGNYTLRFSSDLTIHGNDACNTCEGSYLGGTQSRIKITPSCTEVDCSPSPPFGYADALGRVTSFHHTGDQLTLVYRAATGGPWVMVHVRNE